MPRLGVVPRQSDFDGLGISIRSGHVTGMGRKETDRFSWPSGQTGRSAHRFKSRACNQLYLKDMKIRIRVPIGL